MQQTITAFRVNGSPVELTVPPQTRLSTVLREMLGLTGLKEGCREGECGACTVLMDGVVVNACLVPAFQVEGAEIETIEGLAPAGELSDLQMAFLAHGAVQCGFCTPGMVMAAEGFLRANPQPDAAGIAHALAGNLCRCTGYQTIVAAVADTARRRVRTPR